MNTEIVKPTADGEEFKTIMLQKHRWSQMTNKEEDLVHEIYTEGSKKYAEKLEALAEVLGDECDSERMAKKMCIDIWKELLRLSRIKEYDRVMRNQGIIVSTPRESEEAGITVNNPGCEISHLQAYWNNVGGYSLEITTFDELREPLFYNCTATDAVSHIRRMLNIISLWTVVASRFKEIKKKIEAIEIRNSDKRVSMAKKVLDIIRKL